MYKLVVYISCPSGFIAVTGRRILLGIRHVETSVHVLCEVPYIWLKILGMFNLPMLWLSARSLLLICMASLETCFLYWSIILNWEILALGWLCVVQCWNIVLVDKVFIPWPAFQASAWFFNVRRIALLINTGPLINHILERLCWNFVFGMH